MNKELIKKYKKEFEHWVNEGKLLCYTEVEGPYYEVSDATWEFACDVGFIINDEYVEFRKALAEGKTVEVLTEESNINRKYWSLDVYTWTKTQDIDTNIEVKNYRIKPEEADIKVDEYIYDIQKNKYYRIVNVLEEKVETTTFRVWKSAINGVHYKLWKPKPGELVIMKTDDYSIGFTVTLWEENSKFTPVPFIGELPE